MSWYKRSTRTEALYKTASAQSIAEHAIQLLDSGMNRSIVAMMFNKQMLQENPSHDKMAALRARDLKEYLTSTYLGGAPSTPSITTPAQQPVPSVQSLPSTDKTELPLFPEESKTTDPIDEPKDEITPEVETEEPTTPEGEFEVGQDFEALQEEIKSTTEIIKNEEPVSPAQQAIEEDNIAQDIQEIKDEVPELERADAFEDMTLDIRPEDMTGQIEEVKHIEQKAFSIPTTFKVKDDNLKKLIKRIEKINQYKDSKGLSPLRVVFKSKDGRASSEPMVYQKEITNPRNGESHYSDYVDFVLEGEVPNPLGNPVKEVKNPDGTVSYEEVVYQIIGSIEIVPIEGYEPKEEKFKTDREAQQHSLEMNAKDPTRQYAVGRQSRSQKFKEIYPETDGKFYPSTYKGKWRTVVNHYPNSPAWKRQYKEGSPLDCDHCKVAKRGMTARRSVYVAIEYPAAQLLTASGKPRDPLPEEIMKGKQVWIGSGCVEGQKGALQFINDLTKLKETALEVEKTGRMSDAFGGSMSSPKGILPIMANYFAAGLFVPSRSGRGNWYKRHYGTGLSESDFKEFKKYYFGQKRSEMRKAAIEVAEWEQDVKQYPEALQKHENAMALYPYLMEQWVANGENPENKPAKPAAPKKPKDTPPKGPAPLPWGESSEKDMEKAKTIIDWWKAKANDPTVNYNDLTVNKDLGVSGEKTHNLISIAMSGKVDSNFFEYIPQLVQGYDKAMLLERRQREEQERVQNRLTQPDNGAFNARRMYAPPDVETPAPVPAPTQTPAPDQTPVITPVETNAPQTQVTEGPLGGPRANIQDISQAREGDEFTSRLTHVRTQEYGGGRYSDFKDDNNHIYRIFDNYKKKRRDPKYDFQNGESYVLKGRKGETSDRWRNTVLNNVTVVDDNAANPAEATPVDQNQQTPTILDPETPAENTTPNRGIQALDPEDRAKKLDRISKISDYAKNVVTNGRTRDTQNEWGDVVPGREMTPEELIPMYVEQLHKTWDVFNKDEFIDRLSDAYRRRGKEGLIGQINLVPSFAKNLI